MKLKSLLSGLFVLVVLVLITVTSCDTTNSVDPPYLDYFVKYFGSDGDQTAVDFLVNGDNSIIVLGNSKLDATSGNKMLLVKTDQYGNLQWQKTFGNQTDIAVDISFTSDGHFIVLSNHQLSADNVDIKIIRISPDGQLVDSTVYGTGEIELAESITPLSDGGFIVTGSTGFDAGVINPGQTDESDIFHFRCNSSLQFDSIQWIEEFGSGPVDRGAHVSEYSNNIFYVFGSTDQVHEGNTSGNENLFYYQIDNNGVNGRPNYLGDYDNNTEADFVLDVPSALGGGYLIGGTERRPSSTRASIHVTKLRSPLVFDSLNDEQFDREISIDTRNLTLTSAAAAINGGKGYLLLANEQRETGNNIWITKIDQSGNQIWSASYGSEEEDDMGAAIIELQNGRILVVGSVRLINNQYKIVLMKLNSSGQLMN